MQLRVLLFTSLCSTLISTLHAMNRQQITVSNQTNTTLFLYWQPYINGVSINKQTTGPINLPNQVNSDYSYVLKIPGAAPDSITFLINKNSEIQYGNHITIQESDNAYSISKNDHPSYANSTTLNKQAIPIIMKLSTNNIYQPCIAEGNIDNFHVHNSTKDRIKITPVPPVGLPGAAYYIYQTEFYYTTIDPRTLPSLEMKISQALQKIRIIFDRENSYQKHSLTAQLSSEANFIEITNQAKEILARLYIKNTMFNVDTKEIIPSTLRS